MKVIIDNHRGWEISFDTELETFYCISDRYDRDETKKSFASIKKFIDDFIKENEIFEPVWVETKPNSYTSDKKIKLIGIRKDGRFIYENSKGEKQQLSDYNEKDYILYDANNDKFRLEAEKINKEIKVLNAKRDAVLDKITGIELTEYKKELLSS